MGKKTITVSLSETLIQHLEKVRKVRFLNSISRSELIEYLIKVGLEKEGLLPDAKLIL